MLTALVWKEWLKLRSAFLVLLTIHLAMNGWAVASLRSLFSGAHPEALWYQAAILGNIYFDMLRHLPWISGLILAAAQHLPEIRGKRLRLTLHLPVRTEAAMACSVLFGAAMFLFLAGLDATIIGTAGAIRYPAEIVTTHLWALLPMQAAGLAAYFGASTVLFEPSTSRKLHLGLLAIAATAMLLVPVRPGAWNSPEALILGLLILAALAVTPFLTMTRQRLTGKNQ